MKTRVETGTQKIQWYIFAKANRLKAALGALTHKQKPQEPSVTFEVHLPPNYIKTDTFERSKNERIK